MKKIFYLALFACMAISASSYAQSGRSGREKAWRMERERQRAENRALELRQDSASYYNAERAL